MFEVTSRENVIKRALILDSRLSSHNINIMYKIIDIVNMLETNSLRIGSRWKMGSDPNFHLVLDKLTFGEI